MGKVLVVVHVIRRDRFLDRHDDALERADAPSPWPVMKNDASSINPSRTPITYGEEYGFGCIMNLLVCQPGCDLAGIYKYYS